MKKKFSCTHSLAHLSREETDCAFRKREMQAEIYQENTDQWEKKEKERASYELADDRCSVVVVVMAAAVSTSVMQLMSDATAAVHPLAAASSDAAASFSIPSAAKEQLKRKPMLFHLTFASLKSTTKAAAVWCLLTGAAQLIFLGCWFCFACKKITTSNVNKRTNSSFFWPNSVSLSTGLNFCS